MPNEPDAVEKIIGLIEDLRTAARERGRARTALSARLGGDTSRLDDNDLVKEGQRLIGQIVMGRRPIAS